MAEVILFSVLHQATQAPPGMTPEMLFVLELLKIIVPLATAIISALALRKVGETHREVGVLSKNVDGKMTQLLHQTERAAHAEGVAEGVAAAAVAPIVQPQVVIVPPDVKPGGSRRTDPPAPPVPHDQDPTSHA